MRIDPPYTVGTSLLFESERVRVWELVLEPGESSGVHTHVHDYVFVYVTPDNRLEVRVPGEPPAPTVAGNGFVSHTRVGDGSDRRLTHELVNVGETTHRQVLVELLDGHDLGGDARAVTLTNERGRQAWGEGSAARAPANEEHR
jgi:hypothetical protein